MKLVKMIFEIMTQTHYFEPMQLFECLRTFETMFSSENDFKPSE